MDYAGIREYFGLQGSIFVYGELQEVHLRGFFLF